MDEQKVQQMIDQGLSKSFDKRIGDTPTDAYQLTPKRYVDGGISSVISSVNGSVSSIVTAVNTEISSVVSAINIVASVFGTPTTVLRHVEEQHIAANWSNGAVITFTPGFLAKIVRMTWSYPPTGTTTTTGSLGGTGTWFTGGTYTEAGWRNTGSGGGATAIEAWSDAVGIVGGQGDSTRGAFSGAIGGLTSTTFELTLTNSSGGMPFIRITCDVEG